jgi:hypothetical protein
MEQTRIATGWVRFFAWLLLAVGLFSAVTTALILSLGRVRFEQVFGIGVTPSNTAPLALLEQGTMFALIAACIGVLRESRRAATLAMYCSLAVAMLQGWQALGRLPSGTFLIPIGAMAYLAFAAGLRRRLGRTEADDLPGPGTTASVPAPAQDT